MENGEGRGGGTGEVKVVIVVREMRRGEWPGRDRTWGREA
jgi:hypothetical protein